MNCKDCRYFDTEDGKEGYCQEFVYPVNDKCFCNIDSAPPEKPKPDIVEVVRCKDCKYRYDDGMCFGRGVPLQLVPDDGFCDKGERRDDEDEQEPDAQHW